MPTKLSENQVGFAVRSGVTRDVSPEVACPYCDQPMNPKGNIRTHTVRHPNGAQIAFYRTHKSCALEANPCEENALAHQALELLEATNRQMQAAALLRKH